MFTLNHRRSPGACAWVPWGRGMLIAGLLGLGLSGCAGPGSAGAFPRGMIKDAFPTVPVQPPVGFLVSTYSAPLQVDYEGEVRGSKRGTSQALFVREPFTGRFSVTFGDASIAEAMADGGITKVTHIDYEVLQVLGLFCSFTVVVYGE